MKDAHTKSRQATTERSSGLHNDFSEQEELMTASAMPPAFALTAGAAAGSPGNAKAGDVAGPEDEKKPTLNIAGVPPELVVMLEQFEGIRWEVYADTKGHLTGGMGHKITEDEMAAFPEGATISQAQVEAWAQKDVLEAWNRAQEQSAELGVDDHDFFVAMASMCFQNGLYWNKKHVKTWALMKEHKWEEAAIECADSDWARQTPTRVPGFQAALRSQVQGGAAEAPAATKGVLYKHERDQKSKAEKLEDAQAGKGAKGSDIAVPKGKEGMKEVQTRLKALGLYNGAIDGIAPSKSNTVKGIKDFQKMKGLAVTGVVDAGTWAALNGASDGSSIFERFMEKQGAGGKTVSKDDGGLAAPFAKMAMEAKAGKGTQDAENSGTGNFIRDEYWRSQLEDGESRAVNWGNKNCRLVSSEMLLLYLKQEKPEMLEVLGLADTNDLKADVGSLKVIASEEDANFLSIMREDKSHKEETQEKRNYNPDQWYVESDQASKAVAYIESYLQQQVPVLVGVDHTYNRDINTKASSKRGDGYNEGTTDHFITLSGIGTDKEGNKYYSFVDPGRSTKAAGSGSNVQNRLYHQGGGVFKGSGTGSSNAQVYHLSMVVLFPADREKFAAERALNRKTWID